MFVSFAVHRSHDRLFDTQDRIKRDIESATSACHFSTFIFDEVDKMPIKLLETIIYYIDFHTPSYAQPIDFRKTIFIFLRYDEQPRANKRSPSPRTLLAIPVAGQ